MLPRFLPAAAAWMMLAGPLSALTPAVTSALDQALTAMRSDLKSQKNLREEQRPMMEAMIARLPVMAESDPNQFEQTLLQYTGYFTSKEAVESLNVLKAELAAERKRTEAEEQGRLKALLAKVSTAVKTAKEPAELDGLLTELAGSRRNQYGSNRVDSEELQRLYAALEPAKYFVERWQDYLAGIKEGDRRQARQALNELRQSGREGGNFIARSELLELIHNLSASPGQMIRVIDGIRSLEDIRPAVAALQGMTGDNDNQGARPEEYIAPLVALDKSYREFKAGLSISVELDYQAYSRFPQEIASKMAELRGELIKLALPRYVNAPVDPEIKAGESVIDFLDRLEAEAKTRGDAATGLRIKQAKRLMTRGESFSSQDTTGLNAWNSGQNQETAGQWELAVVSYQQALKSGSDLVPAKLIGERLAAIREGHPQDYENGMERFLAPPSGYNNYPSSADRRNPAQDDRNRKTSPTLLIPPAGGTAPTPEQPKEAGQKQ